MKVLVIGEVCIDTFVYGKIDRLCPEAPVPVFVPTKETKNSGMGGNVVDNIRSICPQAEVDFWHQPETINKKRLVDEKTNQMIVRIDEGELVPVTEIYKCGHMNSENLEKIKYYDLVIVSDYNKGFLSDAALLEIAANAKLSILDSKRTLSKTIANMYTFVKMNAAEADLNSHIADMSNVIVTLGGEGAKVRGIRYEQENPQETIDVSGAGDTFVAAFGLEYAKEKNLERAVNYANRAAGIVVGKRGVSTPF